jgi:ABC-type branched-subunit amino acid transport system ATPase component
MGRMNQKDENSLIVLIGDAKSRDRPLPENHILIIPNDDRWNDFGFRTKVDVHVKIKGIERAEPFVAFIGFLTSSTEESNGVHKIEELLKPANGLTVPLNESHHFFTMLPSLAAYRVVVGKFGVADAARVLRSLRDLVVLREFKSSANWLERAVNSEIFLKAFVRASETYFAFKNGGSILRGLEHEELRKLSQSLAITFTLPGRLEKHQLEFNFDHHGPLPKRIAVIIGKNGVGKSQTLGRIVKAALAGKSALIDVQTQSRPLLNRMLAFAPTSESKSVFPTDRRRRPRIRYRRFSLNRSESVSSVDGISDLIVQVARSEESIGDASRWSIFIDAITAIERYHEIRLPSKSGDDLPIRALRSGGEKSSLENYGRVDGRKDPTRFIDGKGYPLSSGEISFLRFAAQASLHIENGSLLLLDEPETHLHPNFISRLVLLLDTLLEKTGSAAIIATHSAYFVREVFPAQVTVLRNDDQGEVVVERPQLRTFGADVGAISYFVFGEDESSQLAERVEKRLLKKFKTWDELYNKYRDELSLELLGKLREAMELRKSNE